MKPAGVISLATLSSAGIREDAIVAEQEHVPLRFVFLEVKINK